jgi:uroporphyrinogen-III synthase
MAKAVRAQTKKSPVVEETLPVKEKSVSKIKVVKDKAPAAVKAKKVNTVLITQPRPDSDKSPYYELARKYNLNLDFHPFILVEGLSGKDFRKQRVDINEYTAIVLTSRNAVDHFFRICEELKVKVSQDMKYFCITEAVALYLQKFILYRKRKVFFSADGSTQGLLDVIGKHKVEKYIVPTADNGKNDIHQYMVKHSIVFAEVTLFHTVANDIEPVMKKGSYDMIVFFSPFSVQTLFSHNPEFQQNGTIIGAFGPTTAKAVEDSGLKLEVKAPAPNAPSMVSAMEKFLADQGK